MNIDTSDNCNPIVTLEHKAGCPIYTANEWTIWLSNNPWVLAVFLLIVGPIIALLGKKWFPYVAGIVACISVMDGVAHFAGWMGWLSTTWSPYVVLAVALILGIIAGGIVAKFIWIAVGLSGIIAGGFFGFFIFYLMAATTNHAENWELIALGITFALLGGFLAFKWGKHIVVLGTSFIGSYLFMRGWTLIFDGYPSEAEIWSNIKED